MLLPRNNDLVYVVYLFLPMLLNYYLYTYQRRRLLLAPLVSFGAELLFITFFIGGFPLLTGPGILWWTVLIPLSLLICTGSLCALLLAPLWGAGRAYGALVLLLAAMVLLLLYTGLFPVLWLAPFALYLWAWRLEKRS